MTGQAVTNTWKEDNQHFLTLIKKILWRLLQAITLLAMLALLLAFIAYWDVSQRHRDRILPPEQVDQRPVAIVFGAGVYPGGYLSAVLADRMTTAIELYESGKVEKLLLSGSNQIAEYNEPARMGDFARAQGVPESALAYDYAGLRTYDTCYRAKHIFGLDRVVLVTQDFHLPRALYTCDQLGIDAVGVAADKRPYRFAGWFEFREALARARAWTDVHLRPPAVIGGETINIFYADYNGRIE